MKPKAKLRAICPKPTSSPPQAHSINWPERRLSQDNIFWTVDKYKLSRRWYPTYHTSGGGNILPGSHSKTSSRKWSFPLWTPTALHPVPPGMSCWCTWVPLPTGGNLLKEHLYVAQLVPPHKGAWGQELWKTEQHQLTATWEIMFNPCKNE